MSYFISLYRISNAEILPLDISEIQTALNKVTGQDWSDFDGGEAGLHMPKTDSSKSVSVQFFSVKPWPFGLYRFQKKLLELKGLEESDPKSFILGKVVFKKNLAYSEDEIIHDIDVGEYSIAFDRPQEGFERPMFKLLKLLNLVALKDSTFANTEAIISIQSLSQSNIPKIIDSVSTKDMELLQVKSSKGLLNALYS